MTTMITSFARIFSPPYDSDDDYDIDDDDDDDDKGTYDCASCDLSFHTYF